MRNEDTKPLKRHTEVVSRSGQNFRKRFLRRMARIVRRIFRIPEIKKQAFIAEEIRRRAFLVSRHNKQISDHAANIRKKAKNDYEFYSSAKRIENSLALSKKLVTEIDVLANDINLLLPQRNNVFNIGKDLDKLYEIEKYPKVERVESPFVLRRRNGIKVLLLNSLGGSMGRLSKALIRHQSIDAECFVSSFSPRRQLFYSHEPNANGALNRDEWLDFLKWAVGYYDIVQSTTIPLQPGLAACYDWLTATLGKRHIWRTTGFIHHYIHREEILPLEIYRQDLGKKDAKPSSNQYFGSTFGFSDRYMDIGENFVFYSSPEKGAYLNGNNKIWLPSIRDPEIFRQEKNYEIPKEGEPVKIFIPYHRQAKFKGMSQIIKCVSDLNDEIGGIEIVMPENIDKFCKGVPKFKNSDRNKLGAYTIPNRYMPEVLRQVDIVIDQIIMGCYGNIGIEGMLCEKPVIAQKKYSEFVGCPIIDTDPASLKQVLKETLKNRSSWREIGEASRNYASQNHSPESVANIAAQTYRKVLDFDKH